MIENKTSGIKVSVVVLTYKRQDELLKTLENISTLVDEAAEIIVVNNFNDNTSEVLKHHFPKVTCISIGKNIGCEARNIGVKAAKGDVVITLDNDVHMAGNDFVFKVKEFFSSHPGAGCISFKVLSPEMSLSLRDWCHPRVETQWSDKEFLTDHISEGASAFRKEAFEKVGGYYPLFFIGHEGPELSLRLIKSGYEIWYSPDIKVVHYASASARPDSRAYYFNTRNNIWLAYLHYPIIYALRYAIFYTMMMFFYSLKNRHFSSFCNGIFDALRGLWNLDRNVLSRDAYIKLKELIRYKPTILQKLYKHLNMRQDYR